MIVFFRAKDRRPEPGVLQPVRVSLCPSVDLPAKLSAFSGGGAGGFLEVPRSADQQFHRQFHHRSADAVCHRNGRSALERFSSLGAGVSNRLRHVAFFFGTFPRWPAPRGDHLPHRDRRLQRAADCLSLLLPARTAHAGGGQDRVCRPCGFWPVRGAEQPCGPGEIPRAGHRGLWLPDSDWLPRLRRSVAQPLERTRSEEHTSELQSRGHLVCRLLLEKKKKNK